MTPPAIPSVYQVFVDIQSDAALRRRMVAATSGAELENYLKDELSKRGFNRVTPDGLTPAEKPAYNRLRTQVKDATEPLANPIPRPSAHYIEQPNGSPDYPDFIVFEGAQTWSIAPKHRSGSSGHPMWNSGTPRQHGIYRFGNRQDVTFSLGGDLLTDAQLAALQQYRHQTRALRDAANQGVLAGPEYGFAVYDRFMLQQQRTNNRRAVLNFFTNPKRVQLENRVLAMLRAPAA